MKENGTRRHRGRAGVLGGPGSAYDNRNHFLDDFGFAPVPEPSALVLAGLGLATLVRRMRMRRG